MEHTEYRKITAIIHVNSLEAVEEALKSLELSEVAITRVRGYGDYKNFYNQDWISDQDRVEVFAPRTQVARVVEAIGSAAYTGLDTDSVIEVLPVEMLRRI